MTQHSWPNLRRACRRAPAQARPAAHHGAPPVLAAAPLAKAGRGNRFRVSTRSGGPGHRRIALQTTYKRLAGDGSNH